MVKLEEKKSKCPELFCLNSRKSEEIFFNPIHRWTIYMTGLLETLLFGGCIFGWSQLVYVLKNEEVFLDYCTSSWDLFARNDSLLNNETILQDLKISGCNEQDQKFALIYSIGATVYCISAIAFGMVLHRYGLIVSRTISSISLVFGFLALGSTNKDQTLGIYLSMTLLALGGNGIRLSGLQFCNLFPKYRTTALAIISGSYASSAGSFLVYYLGQIYGISVQTVSTSLACVAGISLVANLIMPWHSIPLGDSKQLSTLKLPISNSLLSISTCTFLFWFTVNIVGLQFYAVQFNAWITKISETNEQVCKFSWMYSLVAIFSFVSTPFPGLITDYFIRRATKASSPEEKFLKEMRSPSLVLFITSLISSSLIGCYFFNNYTFIYTSLIIFNIARPLILSTASTFIRMRYPAEHFDRLNGVIGTAIGILALIQYPFFIWTQHNFFWATVTFLATMLLTVIHPLHLHINSYMNKIVQERFSS